MCNKVYKNIAISLWSPQLPIHWVPGAVILGVNLPECEAAEVKNAWSYSSTHPSTSSWCSA